MRRRGLLALAAGAAAFGPFALAAQQRRIGTLTVGSQAAVGWMFETMRQALGALGYGDGSLSITSRWADGHAERLPELAAELVRLSPAPPI